MADTYTFSFYDDGDDNYRFTSTLNGTTIDNTTAISSVPHTTNTSWSGTFGSGTTIFGSSYLNSNLVGFTISGSNATMTLADGTVLEGTTSYSYPTRTFSNMEITSSGSGGGGGSSDSVYRLVIGTNGPSGMPLTFYKDGTQVDSVAGGGVNIWGNGVVNFSGYTWPSSVTSSWGGYPTGGQLTEDANEDEIITLTLSNGLTLVGEATKPAGYFYSFDNMMVDSGGGGGSTPTQLDQPTATASISASGVITISGLTDANADGYKVKYWNTSSSESNATTTNTLTPTSGSVDINVTAGLSYYLKVQAIGDGTTYSDSEWSAQIGPVAATTTTLSPPTNFACTVTSAETTVAFTWTQNDLASGYKIRYALVGTEDWTEVTASSSTSHLATVTTDGDYKAEIKALGNGTTYGDSDWSGESYFTIGEGTPTEPTQLDKPTPSAYVTGASIYITGLNVANESGYRVKYWKTTAAESTATTLGTQQDYSGTLQFQPGPGFSYYVKVQAVGDQTNYTDSEWSSQLGPFAVTTTLSAPTGLTATASGTSISCSWNTVSAAAGYKLSYKTSASSSWSETDTIYTTTHVLTELSPSTTYNIRVKSVGNGVETNDSGYSTSVNATTESTTPEPDTPTALSAPTITGATGDRNSVIISGLNVANATGYVLSYTVHGSDSWTTTSTVQAVSGSYTITGLTVETQYDVKAKAIGDGETYLDSVFSSTITCTTAPMSGLVGGIFRPIETTSAMLNSIEVESGQFIICTDTRKMYYDTSSDTRIELL